MRGVQVSRIIVALVLLVMASGCQPSLPTFVSEGRNYDSKSALLLAEKIDDPGLSNVPVLDAEARRHDALTSLRSQGGSAEEAAELITRVFPSDVAAVPYYVEEASYEGTPSFVIVEAMGPDGGTLADRRTWVISKDGDVLISGSR